MSSKSKRARLWVGVALVVAVCGAGTWYYLKYGKTNKNAQAAEVIYDVKKGDIRSSITGTSQFEAKDMQLITGSDSSVIKTMKLNRNMDVKKGDLLVELSSPTLDNSMQKAQVQLNQQAKDIQDTQNQISALQTKAAISGKLTYVSNIDVGSTVSRTTKIATIADTRNLIVSLPFAIEDASQLVVGDVVDLTFDGFLMTKSGTISAMAKEPHSDAKGGRLVDASISIANDSSMDAGMKAKGSVVKGNRTINSTATAVIDYGGSANILAGVSGTISQISAKDGTYVNKGDLIDVITNDTILGDLASKQNSYDNQKLTIQDMQDKIDALKIKAPFDGVFSTDFVNKKTNILATMLPGAKVSASTQFGGVADTKSMNLPIQVDELDLPNVKAGMKAVVRVDSLQGQTFDATVGQVSTVGTTTNGVTFFDVVLTVTNKGNTLKYGMTSTGEILLQDVQNVIKIPTEALQSKSGKRFVTLKKDDGTYENDHEIKIGARSKTEIEVTEGLKEGDKVVIPLLLKQQKLSQAELDKLRQQFQGGAQGAAGAAGNLTPEQVQALRDQFGGQGAQGGQGGTNNRNTTGNTGGNAGGTSTNNNANRNTGK